MINIRELSLLSDFKYICLSDKISMGEANLDGNWIWYYDRSFSQIVNLDDHVLKIGTIIYGDENIIWQKDGTLFIREKSKDLFNTNGDIIGYLYNIENRWRNIKKEGDRHLPFKRWHKELYEIILFVAFCLLTVVGGTKGLPIGLGVSFIVSGILLIIGLIVLSSKAKGYVKEYIISHGHDDYSKILINDYLSE